MRADSFVFSGIEYVRDDRRSFPAKSQVAGTGYDFADFLLGRPQQTSVQFGQNNYHFRGNYWDLYAQDEWKIRGNFTLNAACGTNMFLPSRKKTTASPIWILPPGC